MNYILFCLEYKKWRYGNFISSSKITMIITISFGKGHKEQKKIKKKPLHKAHNLTVFHV